MLEICDHEEFVEAWKRLILSHFPVLHLTIAKSISSQARYDHFDTLPYLI